MNVIVSAEPVSQLQKPISRLSVRNKLAFCISIFSFFLLFPGIYLSMLSITSKGSVLAEVPHVEKGFLGIPKVQGKDKKHMNIKVFDTTRSILTTVKDMWKEKYFFVASMIFLFSVIVPVIKGLALTYIFFTHNSKLRRRIIEFIKSIGKWSMCDVFITAIFLSYLATGATGTSNSSSVSIMSYTVPVNVNINVISTLHLGFWCFLSYCVLSLIALQLYEPF